MPNCVMCGDVVPEGQNICSMCYGDIDYGRDGYYREMENAWEQSAMADQERDWEEKQYEKAQREEVI